MKVITTAIKKLFLSANNEPLAREEDPLISRYQVLVENLAASLVIRDSAGSITYCSPYIEVLTGYSLPEIYAYTEDFLISIAHQDDRLSLKRAVDLARIGESYQIKFRFYHRSGIELWAESRSSPLYDEQGSFIASISILLDVTQAVRQEELLAERSEDLKNITSIVAEDIQNEVFTIQGMLQLAREEQELTFTQDSIANAASKLEELADGLTEFGRTNKALEEVRPVSLNLIFKQLKENSKYKFNLNESAEVESVLGSKEEIYCIFDAITAYGSSLVTDETILSINIKTISKESYVDILICGSWPKNPSDKAGSIFNPRRSIIGTKKSGIRIPLSLFLAKRRANSMGGSLEYRDDMFVLTLRKVR